jgi:hypothetical protein
MCVVYLKVSQVWLQPSLENARLSSSAFHINLLANLNPDPPVKRFLDNVLGFSAMQKNPLKRNDSDVRHTIQHLCQFLYCLIGCVYTRSTTKCLTTREEHLQDINKGINYMCSVNDLHKSEEKSTPYVRKVTEQMNTQTKEEVTNDYSFYLGLRTCKKF